MAKVIFYLKLKILPNIHIAGFDKSKYALKNAHKNKKKSFHIMLKKNAHLKKNILI